MWVYNSEMDAMEYREVSYVPGLYKIFDEIVVNAADNKQRDPNMDEIRITVDRESGEISVWNNGRGIPIEIHSVRVPISYCWKDALADRLCRKKKSTFPS